MTQEELLVKITNHMRTTGESYLLSSENERHFAGRLVECGLAFYSMDRDHILSYERRL